MPNPSEYAFGHSTTEMDRLTEQARFYEPLTRRLFVEAGIEPGMSVLDIGCGNGDVALLVSDLVGPSGHVVALDKSPTAVEAARARLASCPNIEVAQGDLADMSFDRPFDAVVGRLVLMYCPDPVLALKRLGTYLAPGGLLVLQELDLFGALSLPPAPLFDEHVHFARETLRRVGSETRMGLKLYSLFQAAGFPAPALRHEACIGGGPDYLGYAIIAHVVRSLLPIMERVGVATAEQIQIDTLADRIGVQVAAGGGIIVTPPLIGAYAKKP